VRVAVVGASGFIGRRLGAVLRQNKHEVVPLSLRNPATAAAACEGCDAVVNLSGEPVAQRWTPEVKEKIRFSRVDAPRALIEGLGALAQPPKAYISASAIGYYGTSDDELFTEVSPPGQDFLAQVCVAWEAEADRAAQHGMRVAKVRNGIVLGFDGGALAKLLPVFMIGAGGPVASGRQWCSWVHLDDGVNLFSRAIVNDDGVLNATAPTAVRNADFTKALAAAAKRPAFIPVPEFAVKLLLGEGAYMLTQGQRVLPERTLQTGFQFRYDTIDAAFAELFR
jgi:uncharacterized protein